MNVNKEVVVTAIVDFLVGPFLSIFSFFSYREEMKYWIKDETTWLQNALSVIGVIVRIVILASLFVTVNKILITFAIVWMLASLTAHMLAVIATFTMVSK